MANLSDCVTELECEDLEHPRASGHCATELSAVADVCPLTLRVADEAEERVEEIVAEVETVEQSGL